MFFLFLFPNTASAWQWGSWKLKLQLHVRMGYDDNVRRLTILNPQESTSTLHWARLDGVVSVPEGIPPASIQQDGLHQWGGLVTLRYADAKHIWSLLYGIGGKVFFQYRDESALAQKVETQYYYRIHRRLLLGVTAQGADNRRLNQSREYSFASAQAVLMWFAPQGWLLSARAGYNGFAFRHLEAFPEIQLDGFSDIAPMGVPLKISDGNRFTYHGDIYHVSVRKQFHRIFRAQISYDFARLFYRFRFDPPVDADSQPIAYTLPRTDYSHQVGLTMRFLYVVLVELSYFFDYLDSPSYGESFLGHRINLLTALELPWQITLVLQAQLLFRFFRNGLTLNNLLQQADNDANLTTVTVRLSRPIAGPLHLDLRYSFYTNRFSAGGLQYLRNLFMAGVSLRF
ncbi:MAG: hypothetical protein H6728_03110 [Myxococcales bacterium]|nr:hypothetical protein [Myxococcales bacterium]